MIEPERLEEFAHRLSETSFAELLGAKDVLVWTSAGGHLYIAFRGPARKLERLYRTGGMFNDGARLDYNLQRAGNVPVDLVGAGWNRRISSPLGQLVPDGETSYVDLLSAVAAVARFVIQTDDDEFPVHVTLMPNEGEPPVDLDFSAYYSTRMRTWTEGAMPPTRVVALRNEMGDEVDTLVADVCAIADELPDVEGPLSDLIEYRRRLFRWFVTHSFDPLGRGGDREGGDRLEMARQNARLVSDCGGWLYPSLGVGTIIATKFGPVTLVAGTETVSEIFGSRGRWPVTLYATDSWTVRTSEIVTTGARRLLEQLTGIAEYDYESIDAHQWILGPPVESSSMVGEVAPPITGEKRFESVLGRRALRWAQTLDLPGDDHADEHYYPYLEAKVSRIVRPTWWKAVIVADTWYDEALAFLEELGMTQPVITVPGPPNTGWWNPSNEEAYLFAQMVAEQIEAIDTRDDS